MDAVSLVNVNHYFLHEHAQPEYNALIKLSDTISNFDEYYEVLVQDHHYQDRDLDYITGGLEEEEIEETYELIKEKVDDLISALSRKFTDCFFSIYLPYSESDFSEPTESFYISMDFEDLVNTRSDEIRQGFRDRRIKLYTWAEYYD